MENDGLAWLTSEQGHVLWSLDPRYNSQSAIYAQWVDVERMTEQGSHCHGDHTHGSVLWEPVRLGRVTAHLSWLASSAHKIEIGEWQAPIPGWWMPLKPGFGVRAESGRVEDTCPVSQGLCCSTVVTYHEPPSLSGLNKTLESYRKYSDFKILSYDAL